MKTIKTKLITQIEIIEDLIHNIYCRIKPSKIHGIGVFAIRNIPKNTNPFVKLNPEDEGGVEIDEKIILESKSIHPEVKQLVKDFYTVRDGKIEFPARGLNELDISYFMNTSMKPNVGSADDGVSFYTLRDIVVGEELLINYEDITDRTEI